MKQHIVRISLGIAVLLIFLAHAAEVFNVRFISQLDAIIYDARLRLTMPRKLDERIVILDIDEKSLGKLGRWPWNRDKMATLMNKLLGSGKDDYGVALIGFFYAVCYKLCSCLRPLVLLEQPFFTKIMAVQRIGGLLTENT